MYLKSCTFLTQAPDKDFNYGGSTLDNMLSFPHIAIVLLELLHFEEILCNTASVISARSSAESRSMRC